MLEFKTATIIDIKQETAQTKRFFLELEDGITNSFIPGQFITLDLPIHEKKNKRLRSYSIASAPNNTNILELVIVILEGGAGTTYLFNEAVIGTKLQYRGPIGHFILPTPLPENLVLICTGTGIAPFRSMIHFLKDQPEQFPNISLVFGTRQETDILYHQEMKQLMEEISAFTYIPVLSRQEWQGATGYVHDHYAQIANTTADAHFMLCGWRPMIDEARAKLSDLGIAKEQIHFELYG